ncbi:MAG TPA: hypothetical protein VGL23_05205, partial [Chloroflexota bacterium]
MEARLVPLQAKRFRLNRAPATDARWQRDLLNSPERTQEVSARGKPLADRSGLVAALVADGLEAVGAVDRLVAARLEG